MMVGQMVETTDDTTVDYSVPKMAEMTAVLKVQ